jgi:DMSO/TMAO reductase YedYZ molybdopterin-dependent catalytic subunit
MRNVFGVAAVFAAILLATQCAEAQDSVTTLAVRGDVLKPGQWSVADLKQQFAKEIQTVKFTSGADKEQHMGTGVPLVSLLLAATPKTEKVPKHYDLTFLVILEALDHYRVFFSLAELLPACGHSQAWLVWEVDGKALSSKEAPIRLVVLSDQGHDRYIYGITSITLVDGTKLAARLPAGQ